MAKQKYNRAPESNLKVEDFDLEVSGSLTLPTIDEDNIDVQGENSIGIKEGTLSWFNGETWVIIEPVTGMEVTSNKAVDFSIVNDTLYPSVEAVSEFVNALLVGLWNDRGNFNASSNLFPSTGGSGISGAIRKGDIWTVSVAGNLGSAPVGAGDTVRALVDAPGQTAANWAIGENNIGYAPENASNKAISLASPDNIKYPTVQAVVNALSGKQDSLSGTGLVIFSGSTPSFIANNSSNWDTAYAYSQIGHLPLAGGTVAGLAIFNAGGKFKGAATTYDANSLIADYLSGHGRIRVFGINSGSRAGFKLISATSDNSGAVEFIDINPSTFRTTLAGPLTATGTTIASLSGGGDVIAGADNTGVAFPIAIGSGLSLSSGVLTATGGSSGTVTTPGMTAGRLVVANSASDIGTTTALTISGSDLDVTGKVNATHFNGALQTSGTGSDGRVSYNAAYGVVTQGKTGATGDAAVFTPAGALVWHNPTGTVNMVVNGTLAASNVSGTSTGTNTGDQDLSGLAVKSNNLSDLTNATTARTNLGLGNVENKSSATIRGEIPSASAGGVTAGTISKSEYDLFAAKAPTASPTFTGTVVLPSTTSVGTVSHTEIGYLDGVTSGIQSQLDAKGAGSVTSVGMTVPTGLTVSGSPITTTGTLAVSLQSGYSIPTTSNQSAWSAKQDALPSASGTGVSAGTISKSEYDLFVAKAPTASPTFTGTVSGISKSMVGLGSVDNTSDASKPISTANQNALDLKANLASPTFTGTVGGITAAMVGAPSGSGSSTGANTGDNATNSTSNTYADGKVQNSLTASTTVAPSATAVNSALSSKANTSSLATVATSGAYADLTGKPTIPTNNSQLTNGEGFITDADITGKEDISNKSTTTTLGTSNTLYPTQNAVKVYVDNAAAAVAGIGGTYTPTFTGVSNIAVIVARKAFFTVNNGIVHVQGAASVTTTAGSGTNTFFRISLPSGFESLFSTSYDLSGNGSSSYTGVAAGSVTADISNDEAVFGFNSNTTSTQEVRFSFMYEV